MYQRTHIRPLPLVGSITDPHVHRCKGIQQHHVVRAKIALIEVAHWVDDELSRRV